jgi:hypothetical protein
MTIKDQIILMKVHHPNLTQEQIAVRLQTPTTYVWFILKAARVALATVGKGGLIKAAIAALISPSAGRNGHSGPARYVDRFD